MRENGVSVIVTLHSEAELFHPTYRSILAALDQLRASSINFELLLICDSVTEEMHRYLSKHQLMKNCTFVSYGDLSSSRNHGLKIAKYRYVSIMDGDDIVSTNWLSSAYQLAENNKDPKILYFADFVPAFGAQYLLFRRTNKSLEEIWSTLISGNPFDSFVFFNLDQLNKDDIDYHPNRIENSLGFEDWYLILECFCKGYQCNIVPNTARFYRRKKSNSLLSASVEKNVILDKNPLFDPKFFAKFSNNIPLDFKNKDLVPRKKIKIVPKLKHYIKKIYRTIPQDYRKKIQNTSIGRYVMSDLKRISGKITREIDPELVALMLEANHYEPLISPIMYREAGLESYSQVEFNVLGYSYAIFCQQNLEKTFDWVIIIPWMQSGGSDKVALNFIDGLCELNQSVLVVITNKHAKNIWINKINKNATTINYDDNNLDIHHFKLLIMRIILQFGINHMFINNSQLGYDLVEEYYRVLKYYNVKIYCSAWAYSVDPEGFLFGYPAIALPRIYHCVDKIITDHVKFSNILADQFGYDIEKFYPIYQPSPQERGASK